MPAQSSASRNESGVIVTDGAPGALAAKAATTTIPIVVAVAADMVGIGAVASLARPGGNVTGTSDQITELSAEVVQLLKIPQSILLRADEVIE